MSYQDSLKERIKELECLYDISTLLSKSISVTPVLPEVCKRLEKAFQYPDFARAKITLLDQVFGYDEFLNNDLGIKQNIYFQDEIIGFIRVGYVNTGGNPKDFLTEEKKLLNKVAEEIAILYERQERTKNEELLNEIVQRKDRLTFLGEMTAGVAHELNTPLGNILGFSEFIINSSTEKVTIGDAKKIRQSALHAREVVKKLMLFSSDVPQKLTKTNLKLVIEEALDLLSPILKQNQIKAEFTDQSTNAFALIDKVQLTQVLFNLLNNAIQASEKKNKVIIKLNNINGFISILVQDFGKGIPAEVQEKIFDPFFTYNKKGHGNGLGLSVVHGIIKKHKGRIQFSSEVDKGTTFVISIPQK